VQVYRDEPLLRSEDLFGGVLQSFDKSFGAVALSGSQGIHSRVTSELRVRLFILLMKRLVVQNDT
jgi:hypothetical protein